ncbi:hypothetical protein [Sneathia sanguinegens]|uniref:hypothetical protein n=1 Tax=Sneathia sanguinegens TaxID=40543 RepID=UPI00258EC326|nr:hypothetical protein [Sneathia sanguinegens]MDU4652801.1 hypothetical protein [Sneathia sanguinegens]
MDNLELLKIEDETVRNDVIKRLDIEVAVQKNILEIEAKAKEMKEQATVNREFLLDIFTKYDIKSVKLPTLTFTRVDATTRKIVDSSRLKTELPDIYAKYTKDSNVKSYLKITENKNK